MVFSALGRQATIPAAVVLGVLAAMLTPSDARAQAGIPYLAEPDRPTKAKAKPKPKPTSESPPETDAAQPIAAPDAAGNTTAAGQPAPATPAETKPEAPTLERNPGKPFAWFADVWARRRAAITRGDAAEASRLLTTLVEAKMSSGWPDIFVYGDALAREANEARARGDATTAVSLAGAATLVAPHRPGTHFALGRAYAAAGRGLNSAASAYWRGITVTATEPPLARAHLGNVLVALAAALLVAAMLLTLVSLYRHAGLFFHDLHHLMPPGATRLQAVLVGVAILLTPIFMRLGPAWVVLSWLGLLSVYFDRRERIGAIVAVLALAVVSFGLPAITAHLAFPGSRAQDVFLTARDAALGEAAAARLEARKTQSPEEQYALGLRARWSGDLPTARRWLDKAALSLDDEDLLVTAGNVRYFVGDRPGAIEAYEKALRVSPSSLPALFNLSRVYFALMEHQKAGEAQRRAMSIDLERVERLIEEAKRATGAYLVEAQVPARLTGVRADPGRAQWRMLSVLWEGLGGGTNRPTFALVAALGALYIVVALWLQRLLRPSTLCARCGRPACHRCNPEMPDQAQCGQCYHAFIDTQDVDPQERIRKEIQVHRYRARQTRVRQVLSIFIAGSGQMLRGAFLRGLLLMATFLGLLAVLLTALGVLPELVAADGPRWVAAVVAGVTLFGLYLGALVDGVREDA
jgi:hypothetical protein